MKKLFIVLILSSFAFALLSAATSAALEYPLPGLQNPQNPTPCDYIRALYIFGLGIVGALAVTAIAVGGFLYMTGQVQKGKDYILSALLGLLLLLGSWLLLNTINPDLAKLKCDLPKGAAAPPPTPTPTPPAGPAPDNQFSFDSGIQAQLTDASPALTSFLSCMSGRVPGNVGRISSISDSRIAAGTCSFTAWTSSCSHGQNSCHYGGRNCAGKSYAVDFGDEQNTAVLSTTAKQCNPAAFVNPEGNHLHVSIGAANNCGCDV